MLGCLHWKSTLHVWTIKKSIGNGVDNLGGFPTWKCEACEHLMVNRFWLISKKYHTEALYCGKSCIIRHLEEVSNKYVYMVYWHRHAYMPWEMTICWLLARLRWISKWSFCICVCVWRVWRKVARPQHMVHCLSFKDTLSPKWFLVVTFSIGTKTERKCFHRSIGPPEFLLVLLVATIETLRALLDLTSSRSQNGGKAPMDSVDPWNPKNAPRGLPCLR